MSHPLSGQTILVATDLSARSDRAVKRAFDIAGQVNAKVTILSVLDDEYPAQIATDLTNRTRDMLDNTVAPLAGSTAYEIVIKAGDPFQTVLEQAEAVDAALIVAGVHRRRRFFDAVRETTLQRLVRNSTRPVLLAKEEVTGAYSTVVGATDFSPSANAALEFAAAAFDTATVTPIHVAHVPYPGLLGSTDAGRSELEAVILKDAETSDAAWRDQGDLPANLAPTRFEAGSGTLLVEKLLKESNPQLVALGAHGRVGARRAILGSYANEFLREPPCDVLIARSQT